MSSMLFSQTSVLAAPLGAAVGGVVGAAVGAVVGATAAVGAVVAAAGWVVGGGGGLVAGGGALVGAAGVPQAASSTSSRTVRLKPKLLEPNIFSSSGEVNRARRFRNIVQPIWGLSSGLGIWMPACAGMTSRAHLETPRRGVSTANPG